MWLLAFSFIAPIGCFASHFGYCIIAWFSFPSTAAAVLIMYSLTFVVYFIALRQLYIAIVTCTPSKQEEETHTCTSCICIQVDDDIKSHSDERESYKEKGKEQEISCIAFSSMILLGVLMAGCQVWLTSGLVLLPISNLIESAPHYLQNAGNTAFVTILLS